MESDVKLYFKSKVVMDKNFILDDNGDNAIEDYLSTLNKLVVSGYQYVKHSLALTLKLDLSQSYLELNNDTKDLNYVSIANYTETNGVKTYENTCYYFVDDKKWSGEDTLKLSLVMDTLNTCTYDVDYVVSKKTLVRRMHKDRFIDISNTNYYIEFVCEKTQSSAQYFAFSNVITQKIQSAQYTISDLDVVAYKTSSANVVILYSGVAQGFFYVALSGTIGTITLGLHIKAKSL